MVEKQTYRIEGPDDEDSLELPAELVDMFREGDETGAEALGNFLVQSLAQQVHVRVHHSDGETSEELEELNEAAEDLFEERFGVSLSQALGHQH